MSWLLKVVKSHFFWQQRQSAKNIDPGSFTSCVSTHTTIKRNLFPFWLAHSLTIVFKVLRGRLAGAFSYATTQWSEQALFILIFSLLTSVNNFLSCVFQTELFMHAIRLEDTSEIDIVAPLEAFIFSKNDHKNKVPLTHFLHSFVFCFISLTRYQSPCPKNFMIFYLNFLKKKMFFMFARGGLKLFAPERDNQVNSW